MREIVVERSAAKEVATFPKHARASIQAEIEALAADPLPRGSERFQQGIQGAVAHRVRVGDYRVIYTYDEERVHVHRIAHRKESYR